VSGEARLHIPAAVQFGLRVEGAQPVRGALAVRYAVPGGAPGEIALFDIAGRRVGSWPVRPTLEGEQHIVLAESAALRPGMYVVRLQQGALRRSERLLLLR
jgi:hypothetical protein